MTRFRQLVIAGILMQLVIAGIFTAHEVDNWNMKVAPGFNIHGFLIIVGHITLFCFAAKYLPVKKLLYFSLILGFTIHIPFYFYIAVHNSNPLAIIMMIMFYVTWSTLTFILFASVCMMFWLLKKHVVKFYKILMRKRGNND